VSDVPAGLLCDLLTQSLAAWRISGSVEPTSDGAVVIGGEKKIRIGRTPRDSMFRWMVAIGGRMRPALSVVAVLRQVREALDPEYAANKIHVAVAPLVLE
jgi:hypothetical protein